MTKQHNALQAVLDRASAPSSVSVLTSETKAKIATTPARENTVLIGGHFPKPVLKQLRIIAAEEGVTNQALLREALDLLFLKYGKRKSSDL
ncbi:MAG: ribbon-helix-helix domain-containing protein [Pseudomonadota bacterium]